MLSEGEHLHENGHVISLTVLGFTYADIMKWSTEHSHSLAPGKISLFLNQKLDVAKSREMMDILSGYLDLRPQRKGFCYLGECKSESQI